MNRKSFSVIILLWLGFHASAQVLPANRVVEWRQAGYRDTFTMQTTLVNVKDFGAKGDGITDDYSSVVNAINTLNGYSGIIYFPPGTYLIRSSIHLRDSVILQGASSDSTFLIFNFSGSMSNCLNISGNTLGGVIKVTGGFAKDSKTLVVENASTLNAGDYIELFQENGSWDTQPVSWADRSVGQIIRIDGIMGDTLMLQHALSINYDSTLNVRIKKVSPVAHVGIECMSIARTDTASGLNINIYFNYAANCWVRGVESSKSIGSHIEMDYSTNIEVSGCYIHDAYQYDGVSTHGYGITLFQHSGECLIENNIIRHLRHAVSLQCGANGNVIAYNYIIEPTRSEAPSNAGADLSLHGHYPFANLFEGNIVQNIQIDQTWGPSGPYNTFFRNRAELYGLIMSSGTVNTDQQNFIGNEIPNTSLFMGNYILAGSDHFEYGNNVRGTITPSGTGTLNDSSYYLNGSPWFWTGTNPFPSIGPPNVLNSGSISAKDRFLSGKYTLCSKPLINKTETPSTSSGFIIYPVPGHGEITLELLTSWTQGFLRITDLFGRIIFSSKLPGEQKEIKVRMPEKIAAGIYLISIEDGKGLLLQKKICLF